MKLYCKSYWVYIYCKRFYWILLFTILLLFYVSEVGKAKSTTQSVLMILTLNELFQKIFQVFHFTPENFISLALPTPTPFPLFAFFHYSVCTVIYDCNHPFDISTFTHHTLYDTHHTLLYTVSKEYIIAIENTYLKGVFEIKNICCSIKEISVLKS